MTAVLTFTVTCLHVDNVPSRSSLAVARELMEDAAREALRQWNNPSAAVVVQHEVEDGGEKA